MPAIVGSAAVSIVPSMQGFADRLRAQILPDADRIGQEVGAAIGRNARERIAAELRGLPDAHVNLDLDTGEAQAELAALDAEVQKVDHDSRSAGSGFGFLSSGISGVGVATAALLPALPVLTGGVLALGGALATAGSAGAAGAIVLATGISKAVDANKELEAAQQAVNNATTAKTRQAALEKQAALIEQLGPSMIAFGQALKDVGHDWTSFAGSFLSQELGIVAGFERLEKDVLPALRPLVSNTLGVFSEEIGKLDAAVNSAGGQSFFSWLAVEGPRDLKAITEGLGQFAAGFAHLFQASSPLIHELVDGFDHIGASFNQWSQGLGGNSGFQRFMDTVAKDGPILVHTLGDVGNALLHIGIATAPILPPLLHLVDDFANLVSKSGPLAAGLGFVLIGFQGLKIVGTLITPFTKIAGAMDVIGGSAKGAAGEAVGLRAALLDLSALGPIVITIAFAYEAYNGSKTLTSALKQLGKDPTLGIAGQAQAAANGPYTGPTITGYELKPNGEMQELTGTQQGLVRVDPGADPNELWKEFPFGLGGAFPINLQQLAGLGPGSYVADSHGQLSTAPAMPSLGSLGLLGPQSGPYASDYKNPTPDLVQNFMAEWQAAMAAANSSLPPLTGGAGSAISGPSASQTLAGIAALQGINIGQALLQGVATGVSPVDTLMDSIRGDIGDKAQGAADAFRSLFDSMLQDAQQASQTLQFSIGNAPTLGSYTSIFGDANGNVTRTFTPSGPSVLYGLQQTLASDKQFVADINQAESLGLDRSLLSQFISAGPSSDDALRALLQGGKAQVAQANDVARQINSLSSQYGTAQALAQNGAETNTLLRQVLTALAQQLPPAIGQQVAAALNGTAATVHNRSATPSQGVFAR